MINIVQLLLNGGSTQTIHVSTWSLAGMDTHLTQLPSVPTKHIRFRVYGLRAFKI